MWIIGKMLLVTTLVIMFAVALIGFTSVALANEGSGHNHEHEFDFSLFSLVQPLGICALSLLLVTLLTGLFRRKLGKRFLKVHRLLAFATILVALSHGILVLVLY